MTSKEWWPFQHQSLADMSPQALPRDVVVSVPLGFVVTTAALAGLAGLALISIF